jgi:WD40 repeat protein
MDEILLTRIFSVTMWYHFAFGAISLAMFGMTVGAIQVYQHPEKYHHLHAKENMPRCCLWFAITVVSSFAIHMLVPFAAEQHGTVEVLDLRTGNRIRTISAAKWPGTVIYHPESNEIFVSDRADGTCKVFSGENYELVKSIQLAVAPTTRLTIRPATISMFLLAAVTPACPTR